MAIVAMPAGFAVGLVFEIPFQVVDDDEIEQPVIIYVDPGSGDAPKPVRTPDRVGFRPALAVTSVKVPSPLL